MFGARELDFQATQPKCLSSVYLKPYISRVFEFRSGVTWATAVESESIMYIILCRALCVVIAFMPNSVVHFYLYFSCSHVGPFHCLVDAAICVPKSAVPYYNAHATTET